MGHIKKKKKKSSAPQMSDQRQSKAGKPASPRPRWEAATEPSPGEKGRMGKKNQIKYQTCGKGSGPAAGPGGRRRPGFARGLNTLKTTTESNTANREDSPTDEREEKCRAAFLARDSQAAAATANYFPFSARLLLVSSPPPPPPPPINK